MRKLILIIILIAGLLILFGPKLKKAVLGIYEDENYNIEGTWEIITFIYDTVDRDKYQFRPVDNTGSGDIYYAYYAYEKIGQYRVKKRNVTFTLTFKDISKHKLDATFTGIIQSAENMVDAMEGTLEGTRVVQGIQVETDGKWKAKKL